MPSQNPSKLTFEPGKGTIQSSQWSLHAGAASAIAALGGKPLGANRGTSLNLDWIDQVRVNTSAVERRAATLVSRRTVKKDWQIAWLLRAITCMDLTTLSGDDTDGRVRRLSAKARQPLQQELVEKVARVAEATRVIMTRKWFAEAPKNWSPGCIIYLHPTGQGYSRATGAPATAP